jgi:hypothetical protein
MHQRHGQRDCRLRLLNSGRDQQRTIGARVAPVIGPQPLQQTQENLLAGWSGVLTPGRS